MKAIVQKGKNINFCDSKIEQGAIVFIFDLSAIDWIVNKVKKIKLWNKWTSNLSDFNGVMCLALPESMSEEERNFIIEKRFENVVILERKELKYINDGPGTFFIE